MLKKITRLDKYYSVYAHVGYLLEANGEPGVPDQRGLNMRLGDGRVPIKA